MVCFDAEQVAERVPVYAEAQLLPRSTVNVAELQKYTSPPPSPYFHHYPVYETNRVYVWARVAIY